MHVYAHTPQLEQAQQSLTRGDETQQSLRSELETTRNEMHLTELRFRSNEDALNESNLERGILRQRVEARCVKRAYRGSCGVCGCVWVCVGVGVGVCVGVWGE